MVRSILLIDDDRDDYELFAEAISEIDPEISHRYVSTCNEANALDDTSFDLLLLDINMPGKDGFQWLKAIRKQGYASVRIVMFSNSLSPVHIEKAYKEGADLYFPKPESFSRLVKGLHSLINIDWTDPGAIPKKREGQSRSEFFFV